MNNMDSCDVLSSNHFSVTAKLLEVQMLLQNFSFKSLSSLLSFMLNVFDDSPSVNLQAEDEILEKSLTHRSFMTNREIVTKALSSEQATDTRDAFAKVHTCFYPKAHLGDLT